MFAYLDDLDHHNNGEIGGKLRNLSRKGVNNTQKTIYLKLCHDLISRQYCKINILINGTVILLQDIFAPDQIRFNVIQYIDLNWDLFTMEMMGHENQE